MTILSKASAIARYTDVQAGIDRHITAATAIGGIVYQPAALKAVFASATTAIAIAATLRTQWSDAVAAAAQAEATASVAYALLHSLVLAQYGKQAGTVLGDFGMTVPKARAVRTAEQKAASAAKARATRKMRKTMGSVQKKDVKGTVEVPNPGLAGAAPAPPSPSPSASTGTTPAAAKPTG